MGTASPQNGSTYQNAQALSSFSQAELRVLQWRSNPQHNEFIPKVFFQYQQTKKNASFISQCQMNENLPVGVKYQTFIGNLSILYGKLCFQECLYTLKSLLSGFQMILTYFGKAIVESNFCFLTKQGEVKAWIHQDYRRNSFSYDICDTQRSVLDDNKLFLSLQKWLDHNRPSSSPANIIQKILFLVAQLTYEQKEFNAFLQKLDGFITGNILKNFNFDRIGKFINKYIYQNRIFIKYNLLEVIERLYYENLEEKQSLSKPTLSRESQMDRKHSEMSTISEVREQSAVQKSSPILRHSMSTGKKDYTQQFQFTQTKNSQFFNSTAHTNTNGSVKCNSFMQHPHFGHYREGPVYGSYCSSQISGHPFHDVMQAKQNFNKNHIAPQFSMTYSTVTAKIPNSDKKLSSLNPSPKSSFISNRSSVKNKTVEFKIGQCDLKVITERKQTDPQEKCEIGNKQRGQFLKTSILNNRVNYFPAESNFVKGMVHNKPILATNFVEANKASNISIALKAQNNNRLSQKQNIKLFKSNCDSNEKENRKHTLFSTGFKTPNQDEASIGSRQEVINNIFTMKTITKLISSNEKLSEQQQSQGDFPSNQNVSSYSGILASMGRSAELLEVPDTEKLDFRTSKKQKTMFVTNPHFANKTTFNSFHKFQRQ